jgi:2-polyprenyl-3-methyl-5-hydroxy-6-metoxy-1,4-benzoquinol methylase
MTYVRSIRSAKPRNVDSEWYQQWSMFEDSEQSLFFDWIAPVTLQDFAGKTVLEAGCGGGQHTALLASVASSVTAVDLNTAEIARNRNKAAANVEFVDADLCTMKLDRQFDVVICIGVIHHTDDPDACFRTLYDHCRPGGRVIVWTYSSEGNAMVRYGVEPVRKALLRRLSRKRLAALSTAVTAALYPAIYSIYCVPAFRFLPYFKYFAKARELTFRRNVLNVFDKLNAPQTFFTTREKCEEWFNPGNFQAASISIRPHSGVSYSLTGLKLNPAKAA